MKRERFETIVFKAVNNLPEDFCRRLENVDIVIEDYPSAEQVAEAKIRYATDLLGLYEGVPQTGRGQGYNLALPDKITIFQKSIEARYSRDEEIEDEIRRVVRHEIAHHFGIDDDALAAIEDPPML